MSAPAADIAATPSPMPGATAAGLVRSREQFDAGCDVDSSMSTPSSKSPRTSIDSDASSASRIAAIASPNLPTENTRTAPREPDPMVLALLEELECGMCAGVFIEPVALNGCGHVFCGSCVVQWIKSLPPYPVTLVHGDPIPEPVSCPQCRHSPIETATPTRMAKTMVSVLLERFPEAARPPNEHKQAEQLYSASTGILKFPIPPPPPRVNRDEFWKPCRWCYTEGDSWKCPLPVPRFDVPAERPNCIRTDGICPDGHRLCANCERLSPAGGPSSVSCGICGEGFCGDAISGCDCPNVAECKPSAQYSGLNYMLEDSPTDMLAMAFRDNWNEMYTLSNYLITNSSIKPKAILHDILTWLRSAEGMNLGGLLGLMTRADINIRLRTGAAEEMQSTIMAIGDPSEGRVCGGCSDEILCSGLFEWWMRELQKPEVLSKLPANMQNRPNCKHGRKCTRQDNDWHSKKYNHICNPLPADKAAEIQQDDRPNQTVEDSGPNASSDSDTDGEGSDSEDSEDEKEKTATVMTVAVEAPVPSKYVDAEVQWEDAPTGVALAATVADLQPCWRLSSRTAPLVDNTTLPTQPAFSIANLINHPGQSALPPIMPSLQMPSPFRLSSPMALQDSNLASTFAGFVGRPDTPPPHTYPAGVSSAPPSMAHNGTISLSKLTMPSMTKSSPTLPSFELPPLDAMDTT